MPPETDATQYLTVAGILYPDNRLLLIPGYLTDQAEYADEDPESSLVAELLDDQDKVLLRHRVPVRSFCAPGEAVPEQAVTGKVPFPEAARVVRFYRDEILIHELSVSQSRPEVRLEWQPEKVVEGRQLVSWSGEHREGHPLHYILRYSHTGGETWQPLAVGIEENEFEVDFDLLPGGDNCRIGIVATDGVNTEAAETEPFSSPIKACIALILSPADGSTLAPSEELVLRGQGFYLEENEPETERLVWTSSVDGELGAGMFVQLSGLSPGSHEITLVAGREERAGRASVTILVSSDEGTG